MISGYQWLAYEIEEENAKRLSNISERAFLKIVNRPSHKK